MFLDHVEKNANRPEQVEVLIHIDQGDDLMKQTLEIEKSQRRLQLRYIQTDMVRNFFDLWKPLNALVKLTAPRAYFVANVSDEFLFETVKWDDVLREYVAYYPDHIFRVRASRFRHRNYIDFWECGFAPDSLAFYTKRWMDIVGDWNPCLGPDSFQQLIAYYLFSSDRFNINQNNRDIADPFLKFSGEGASLGLHGKALQQRVYGHIPAWFRLMSVEMQREAKRRAMLLKAHIFAHKNSLDSYTIRDDSSRCRIVLREDFLGRHFAFSYKINAIVIRLKNSYRKFLYHYYTGGGQEAAIRSLREGAVFYLCYRFPKLEKIVRRLKRLADQNIVAYYILNRRTRENVKKFKKQIEFTPVNYYLYGTGEYAKTIFQHIRKEKLHLPQCVLEKRELLEINPDLSDFGGVKVLCDQDVLKRVGRDELIIVGSLSFADRVIARLKHAGCQARIVTFQV
ncbi:MAG: hypothetical protein JSW39_00140 [Desulfobacterales bacterium]|nr:MAG: hypothetical protein JSW39_00140 [Desulfobacterales bacterium]